MEKNDLLQDTGIAEMEKGKQMTREEAINTLGNFKRCISGGGVTDRKANKAIDMAIEALKAEAVQDEAAMTKQEILGYLDDVLHPIVSPDNWYVYSDLHDMIGELKNGKTCKQCCHLKKCGKEG